MLVTSGQLLTPRNGGEGGVPWFSFVVRGSPCRPVSMLARATIAKLIRTTAASAYPNCAARLYGAAALASGARLVKGVACSCWSGPSLESLDVSRKPKVCSASLTAANRAVKRESVLMGYVLDAATYGHRSELNKI